ncbi:recombinase family protein [Amycolatopsis sp. NPDC051061]|uniref:recombinase family protein n=1 Tax=Amycolatopsis sp. NPDC051061 TaxID=3155042 RepID=UPI0034403D86
MALRLPPKLALPDTLLDRLHALAEGQGKPSFMYARISMDRVGAGMGVVRQFEEQCDLFERLGMRLTGVYADNDISAYSGKKRPDYLQMLEDVAHRPGTAVTAWHTDRLHRSPVELEDYIAVCEPAGCMTFTVKAGHLDLSTPAGRMVARQLGAVARFESEHKADRIRAAIHQNAVNGHWSGGLRPFGFEPDGETVRYEEAAEIISATEVVLAGGSVRGLVMDANARGATTSQGNRWDTPGYRDMLLRPRNAGLSVYRGEIIGKAVWAPIIPVDTWYALRALLTDPKRLTNGGNNRVKWLGTGLYICGVCHWAGMKIGRGAQPGYRGYRCGNPAPKNGIKHVIRHADSLDDFIEKVIVARLAKPDARDLLVAQDRGREVDTVALHNEANVLRQRLDELSGMFAEGDITAAQLRAGTNKSRERLDAIERDIVAAAQLDPLSGVAGASNVAEVWFGTKPDRSDGLSIGRRRAILDTLLSVTVLKTRPGRHASGLYFSPETVRTEWKERAAA